MKFSESWLRSFVDPACSGHQFSHLLTMAGLEVEEEEDGRAAFDHVVVAEVLAVDGIRTPIASSSAGSMSVRENCCRSSAAPRTRQPESRCRVRCRAPSCPAA
jgi:hypothetical protein